MPPTLGITLGLLGVLLAFLSYRFSCIHTAYKNLERVCKLPDPTCVFAFNSGKGHAIIALMIVLGITLRRSPIPRPFLAVLYTTMGGALLLASLHFYARLWQTAYHKQPCPQESARPQGRGRGNSRYVEIMVAGTDATQGVEIESVSK